MGVVHLAIDEPEHGQRLVDPGAVQLRGRVLDTATDGLHFRWYSGLHEPDSDDPEAFALNRPGDDPLAFSRGLVVGTHVLTFTARDVERDADLPDVTRAGMTGGANPADVPDLLDRPCVVTVLRAEIVEGAVDGPPSQQRLRLAARAPAAWGTRTGGDAYGLDPGEHNTVAYRWTLLPADGDGPAVEWRPGADELTFDVADPDGASGPPRVRFTSAVPAELAPGPHRVVLHVEDRSDPERWHSRAESPAPIDLGGGPA